MTQASVSFAACGMAHVVAAVLAPVLTLHEADQSTRAAIQHKRQLYGICPDQWLFVC